MCLLLVLWRTSATSPVMLAGNREEYFDRPFDPPAVEPGPPAVLCGRDRRAGGTWLGTNQHGLVVAITNRFGEPVPEGAISRGALCRRLLDCGSAEEAAALAEQELGRGPYAGANFVCLDRHQALVVDNAGGVHTQRLEPGLHLLTNGRLNDAADMRQNYARALLAPRFPRDGQSFVAAAGHMLSQGLDAGGERTIVVRQPLRGTVSSAIVTLGARPQEAQFLFAAGSPDRTPYADLSPTLRELLG